MHAKVFLFLGFAVCLGNAGSVHKPNKDVATVMCGPNFANFIKKEIDAARTVVAIDSRRISLVLESHRMDQLHGCGSTSIWNRNMSTIPGFTTVVDGLNVLPGIVIIQAILAKVKSFKDSSPIATHTEHMKLLSSLSGAVLRQLPPKVVNHAISHLDSVAKARQEPVTAAEVFGTSTCPLFSEDYTGTFSFPNTLTVLAKNQGDNKNQEENSFVGFLLFASQCGPDGQVKPFKITDHIVKGLVLDNKDVQKDTHSGEDTEVSEPAKVQPESSDKNKPVQQVSSSSETIPTVATSEYIPTIVEESLKAQSIIKTEVLFIQQLRQATYTMHSMSIDGVHAATLLQILIAYVDLASRAAQHAIAITAMEEQTNKILDKVVDTIDKIIESA